MLFRAFFDEKCLFRWCYFGHDFRGGETMKVDELDYVTDLFDDKRGCVDDIEGVDEELMQMFGQRKQTDKPAKPRRKKPAKPTFKPGDKVMYRKHEATVMFGPYERGTKIMYELRMSDGTVVTAHAQSVNSVG